jgi:hypothetical protein
MSIRYLLVLSLLAGACRSAPAPEAPLVRASGPPAKPWTPAFAREAVLIADELHIEGPPDLIDHIALRQDDETHYQTKTLPEGLWQELVPRAESVREVHAQLDTWSLAAFRRIVVLQRPGEVPVRVRAVGNAFFAWADGSGERREAELLFQGPRGQ